MLSQAWDKNETVNCFKIIFVPSLGQYIYLLLNTLVLFLSQFQFETT